MRLSGPGRTALWIGGGAFVGLAVGGFITNPARASELAPGWIILLGLYVAVVVAFTREKGAPGSPAARKAPGAPVAAAPPADAHGLALAFELPDVPAGFPAVMGRGEPVNVRVAVRQRGPSGLVPAEGAAVQLTATMGGESLQGDGLTGTAGAVEFTLEPEGTGELRLWAQASAGRLAGEARGTLSIVNYDEEIERLFGEFRSYAITVLGPESHADTARELADKLRARAAPEAARALLELARVYELVAYGQRDADRRLYLAVMEQLLVLEHAEIPERGPSALPREA